MKKLLGGIVIVILMLQVQLSFAVTSVPYEWGTLPMGAHGYVTGMVMHPLEQDLKYIRTDVGGAYRWDQAKGGWTQLCDSFTADQSYLYGIDGIAIDPQNTEVVYIAAGTYTWATGDVFKSTNRGATWSKTNLNKNFDSNNGTKRDMGESIAVDPNNSQIIYCGTAINGLWKSTDGASTWQQVTDVVTLADKTNEVRNVAYDKSLVLNGKSQIIYVGVTNKGIYRTTDGGTTWTLMTGTPLNVNRMEVGASGTLYVASTTGLFKYTNSTWTEISYSTQIGKSHKAISVFPTNESILTCVGYSTNSMVLPIYYSTDGGSTWTEKMQTAQFTSTLPWDKATSFSSCTADIDMDPYDAKKVWVSDLVGVFMTQDITASTNQVWTNPVKGIEELCPRDAISPRTGRFRVLTAVADFDGFPYEDITKFPTRQIRKNQDVPWMMGSTQIDYCEEDPNIVLRTGLDYYSRGKVEYSTDNTENWTNITNIRNYVNNSGVETIKVPYGRAAVSAQKNPTTGKPSFIIIPAYYIMDNQKLPAGQNTVPMVSLDMGATWQETVGLPAGANIIDDYWDKYNPIASDRVNGSKFYISCNSYLYVSQDWGLTWTQGAYIGGDYNQTIVHSAPTMEGEVWVGNNYGLYRSQNSGTSLTKLSNVSQCTAFGFGKEAPGSTNPTIYLFGTVDGILGMFRSIDMGSTWVRINDDQNTLGNLPCSIVGDSRRFGLVYVGSSGRGYYVGQTKDQVSETKEAFSENFQDINRNGWTDVGGSWSLVTDGTQVAKQSTATGEVISYAGDTAWVDYNVQAKVKCVSTGTGTAIVGRYTDANNFYFFRIVPGSSGKAQLYKKVAGTSTLLQEVTMTVNAGTWYTLKLSMLGSNITGYVDGVQKVSVTDSSLAKGCIGVRGYDQTFEIDDVKVDAASLLMDNFEDANAAGWTTVNGTWSVVADGTQTLKQSTTTGEAVIYMDNSLGKNYSVEANIKPISGVSGAAIVGRYVDANNYYFLKLFPGTNGKVQLYKKIAGTSTLLNEVAMTINLNTWYKLKFTMIGNILTGFVDGIQKVSAIDSSLSIGRIGMRAYDQVMVVDDVKVDVTALLAENFEDGNSTGWTSTAGSWSVVADGTQVLKQSTATGESYISADNSMGRNYSVELKAKLLSGTNGVCVTGRYIDSNNHYYLKIIPGASGKVQLWKKIAGTGYLLNEVTMTINLNTWYTLTLSMVDNNIVGYVDGMQKVSATDKSFDVGRAGVKGYDQIYEVDDVNLYLFQ